jgi:hypothetical protein
MKHDNGTSPASRYSVSVESLAAAMGLRRRNVYYLTGCPLCGIGYFLMLRPGDLCGDESDRQRQSPCRGRVVAIREYRVKRGA